MNHPQQTQIGFQRHYPSGRPIPVYRIAPNTPWKPTAQHTISAPKDAGTPGFAKWQALFRAGAEVVKGECK